MMKNKGMSTTMIQMFTALLTIGLVAVFWFMFIAYYFDVEASVMSYEVERHNLNLAQVLISSPELAYTDENKIYRGTLDWDKITTQFSDPDNSDFFKKVGYPNSMVALAVKNLDTDEHKEVRFYGPFSVANLRLADFAACLGPGEWNWDMMFRIPPLSPWSLSEITACAANEANTYGTDVRSFPISIKDNTGIHPGKMMVVMMEMY